MSATGQLEPAFANHQWPGFAELHGARRGRPAEIDRARLSSIATDLFAARG